MIQNIYDTVRQGGTSDEFNDHKATEGETVQYVN